MTLKMLKGQKNCWTLSRFWRLNFWCSLSFTSRGGLRSAKSLSQQWRTLDDLRRWRILSSARSLKDLQRFLEIKFLQVGDFCWILKNLWRLNCVTYSFRIDKINQFDEIKDVVRQEEFTQSRFLQVDDFWTLRVWRLRRSKSRQLTIFVELC